MTQAGIKPPAGGSALEWPLRSTDPALAARWIAEGFWTDDSLGTLLAGRLAEWPGTPFVTRSSVHPWRGTFAQVLDLGRRVAGGLRARGVRPGDVVAFQLPNWVEAAGTFYGAALVGAVVAPIVHFYGSHEVRHILRQSRARLFVVADRFGSAEMLANLEAVHADLPALEHVVVVRGNRTSPPAPIPDYAEEWAALADGDPVAEPVRVDPAWPALVAYTSGTTASPKGVVHTHRSIVAEMHQLGATQPPGGPVSINGAPVGHGIGMLAALLIPVERGSAVQMVDVWDPAAVLRLMREEGLSGGAGATYFLTSLLDHPDFDTDLIRLMSHVGLGGSAVPAAVTERATRLGISVVRMYGSTEHPSITGCLHADPLAKRIHTDGRPLPGVEMRLVDDDGVEVGPGAAGEIESRGPDCFAGYVDPEQTAAVFTTDGYYRTEDIGVLDADGYLAITDRKKDIIIRGGENVSAAEVENLLCRIPGVAETAVVAAPDARLGEHACAFLRMLPGRELPDLDVVRRHLAEAGLAKQKWPEELRPIADFPRTPSGKIRKVDLRTRLREEAAGATG